MWLASMRRVCLSLSLWLFWCASALACVPSDCPTTTCRDCASNSCCHWCATGDSTDDPGQCQVYPSSHCQAPYDKWDSGRDFNCARQRLSAGAIAGIVIGCVVFVVIICLVVYLCKRRRNQLLMQPQGGVVVMQQQQQPMMVVQQQPGVMMVQQQQPPYGQPMQQPYAQQSPQYAGQQPMQYGQQPQPMYNQQQPMQMQQQPMQYAQPAYGSQPQYTQAPPPAY